MKRYVFYTLGCRANQYQTQAIKSQITNDKSQIIDFGQEAEVYIINTCTVTADADRKSRHAIRRALKLAKKVIVTGCYARLKGEELKEMFPEIHLTASLLDPLSFSPLLRGRCPTKEDRRGVRIRENLLIEDGCENFCSYCIVPYARGKVRTRPESDVLKEAKFLAECGAREIVLTGINLGAYGNEALVSLLKKLTLTPDLLRVRLSSIEPQYVTGELIETIANDPKICRHLHIPLQSGDSKTLNLMNRKYTPEWYLKLAERIRSSIPDCGLTTDIIVGFPGEGETEFKNTIELVNRIKFSRLHIFTYSRRDLALSAKLSNEPEVKTKKERFAILNHLRTKHMLEFADKYMGKEVELLVEQRGEGLTSNYIRVKFNDPSDLSGNLHRLTLTRENLAA